MNNKNFEKVSKRSTSKDIFIDNENYFNIIINDKTVYKILYRVLKNNPTYVGLFFML